MRRVTNPVTRQEHLLNPARSQILHPRTQLDNIASLHTLSLL